MTTETRKTVTLAGVVGGLALVATSLGGVVKWAVDTNQQLGGVVSTADSLFYNDSVTAARLDKVERTLGIKGRKRTAAHPVEQGLVRKLWHTIF